MSAPEPVNVPGRYKCIHVWRSRLTLDAYGRPDVSMCVPCGNQFLLYREQLQRQDKDEE